MPCAKVDPNTGLTEKKERFCVLYVTDEKLRGNGTDCYFQAFKPKNAKRKTINERASRLLANSKVQARIKNLRDDVADKSCMSVAELLKIAADMARCKLSDFYNDDGNIKPPSEWTDEMKTAAASLKTFEEYEGRGDARELTGHVRELKLWDKNDAVDRLFKYHGLFEKDREQLGKAIGKAIIVTAKQSIVPDP